MRTIDQIVQRIRDIEQQDTLCFRREVLARYLPQERLREFCGAEADLSTFRQAELTEESVRQEIASYMPFAWEKALGHRGISACRSVAKMSAWLWLLGDDDLVAMCEDEEQYPKYGAPILQAICGKYDIPLPDNEAVGRMAMGLPCRDGCASGC